MRTLSHEVHPRKPGYLAGKREDQGRPEKCLQTAEKHMHCSG